MRYEAFEWEERVTAGRRVDKAHWMGLVLYAWPTGDWRVQRGKAVLASSIHQRNGTTMQEARLMAQAAALAITPIRAEKTTK